MRGVGGKGSHGKLLCAVAPWCRQHSFWPIDRSCPFAALHIMRCMRSNKDTSFGMGEFYDVMLLHGFAASKLVLLCCAPWHLNMCTPALLVVLLFARPPPTTAQQGGMKG